MGGTTGRLFKSSNLLVVMASGFNSPFATIYSWEGLALAGPESFQYSWDTVLTLDSSEDYPEGVVGRCLVCQECRYGAFSLHDGKFICSAKCLFNAWNDFVKVMRLSDNDICNFPGCLKSCYSGDTKKHDYCGRSHKSQHNSLCAIVYGTSDGVTVHNCKYPGCQKLCPKYGHLEGYCCKKHKQRTLICERCLKEKDDIRFYDSSSPYYEFSNFYEFAPFVLEGKLWQSSEQYFQAQKFIGTPYESIIYQLKTPREAFEHSRKFNSWKRGDWEDVKDKVMYLALLAKFSSHKELQMLLYSTGERKLVEHTFNDSYWGDGGLGKGQNKLGILLMEVRHILRKEKTKK